MSVLKKPLPQSFHLILLATVGMLIWGYWPEWIILFETWQSDPDYNHGFLVIPISGWLLWQRRSRLESLEINPSWWGIGLILAAGFLRWIGTEFFIPQIETWSIPIWVAGVVLLFGGWSLLQWSGPAIAFLWFMTPLPESMIGFVSLPLQQASAALSTWTLHLFAQPAVRSGTTISLGEHVLEVERACSGLRICYGIMALAVAYVVLSRPRPLRAVMILALALPVAILANSARVTATGLLFLVVSGERAHQYAHDFSGLLMMPLAICLFWLTNTAMEKVIGAYGQSNTSGNMLLLKSGLAILALATGLILWQRKQADAAVVTLRNIAERHETDGHRFKEAGKIREAAGEWVQATRFLDSYCRVRPDDVEAAIQLAEVSEQLAFNGPWQIRTARYYERAWSLRPGGIELGLKQARLAMAGEDFHLALTAAEKLLQQTDSDSPEHLAAFQIKVQAQIQDADRPNSKTSWTQVAETLQKGINGGLDEVSCSYQLAMICRQHPVNSIDEKDRESTAEQVMSKLLTKRANDPMAWFARFAFHEVFPAPDLDPATNDDANPDSAENNTAVAAVPSQSPDADLDRAIELATPSITSETHALWLAAGNRALTRKEFVNARQYFQNAIQAKPAHLLAYLRLASMESTLDNDNRPAKDVPPEQRKAAISVLKQGLSQQELKDDLVLRVELIRQQLQSMEPAQVTEANADVLRLRNLFETLPAEKGVPLQLELAFIESEVYSETGNFSKASQLLESVLTSKKVLSMEAGSGLLSRCWLALGSYFEQQGLGEKASDCFTQAKTLEPDSIPTTLYQAFTAEREQNAAAAADLYADAAARLGNSPQPWLDLARNELRQQLAKGASQQDFKRLNEALEEAVKLGAPEVETAVISSEIAAAQRDNPKAIKILEGAASRNPDSAEIWRRLAIRRQASGDSTGANEALTRYQATVADPLQAVLLETNLLILSQDLENAQRIVTSALQTTVDLESQRQLMGQLVRIQLLNNHPEAAQVLLEEFARNHPDDIQIKVELADLYFAQQRFDLMEQMELQLKAAEGEIGFRWKELRARRLIQLAGKSPVEKERSDLLAEANSLIQLLISQTSSQPKSLVLQGQLALQQGQLADAARYFEAAWTRGERTVLLATELIYVLQSLGDAEESEYYLAQMQNILAVSPQLFDMALAGRSSVSFSDLDRSTQIVQSWVQSITDADSYLRLARTLRLKNVQAEPQRTQWLQETEAAYRKAIEMDVKNSQAWGEFLRFLLSDRKDSDRTISELNAFIQNSEVPELDRRFVTSLLLTELNLPQQATRYWNSTIELASRSTDKQIQHRALVMAAQYYAGRDRKRAIDLAGQAVDLNLKNATSLRLLTALLVEDKSPESIREASKLLDALKETGEQSANESIINAEKRIMASVLYRRAVLLPSEYKAADDLRSASQALQSMKPPTETDAVQLARIVAAQGDKQAALLALSEQARRIGASAATIGAFVEYWQDNFANTETMQDRVQQALETLEKTAGYERTALELRLRPPGLTSDKIKEIVHQFVANVVAAAPAVPQQDGLLQQTFAFLAQKNLSDVSLQLLADELPPLTTTQKLNALVLVTTQTPGPPAFEAALNSTLDSQLQTEDNPDLNRTAGDFFFIRGNLMNAERCYRRCLEQDPNDVGVANNLALVVAELRSDFEEADRLIRQSLANNAKSPSAAANQSFLLDTQSQLLLAAGKNEQALEILLPLSQSVTADASVFLHLAECYHKLNKSEESKNAFSICQQMGIASSVLPPMDKRMYESLQAAQTQQTISEK